MQCKKQKKEKYLIHKLQKLIYVNALSSIWNHILTPVSRLRLHKTKTYTNKYFSFKIQYSTLLFIP